MKTKLKLNNKIWEMIRIKSETKREIATLKAILGYLTFDEVIQEALICFKNHQALTKSKEGNKKWQN